ncbi:hypothetical protein EVAR_23740_1 [Eumeta japonica]|uniref:Uncharacterized protein n=1 Tax=Eumeta variegata TaxID=151549 RepID=A0A4C1VGU9_EUMVA|nr:hypothetical protein EVAR_23740_1 [Eumeta japonica]
MVVDNTTTERKPAPTPHCKAETDPSPDTRGNYGTGTTGRGHRTYRTAAHRLSPPRPDSAYTAETEKGQEGEKERKKDATTATTTAAAINRTEDDRSPSRGESEKSRPTSVHAAPRTTQPRQQLPPLPQQRRPIGRPLPTPTISDLAQEVASLKAAMSEMTKILVTILRSIKTGQDPTQDILEGLTLAGMF